jgi:hypothetical protein
MRTGTILPLTAVALGMLVSAAPASAAIVVMDFGVEFSGASPPAGPAPWLRATFDDGGTPGSVTLTLDNLLTGSEFIGAQGVYFNLDPAKDATGLLFTHSLGQAAQLIDRGTDAYKADGDGFFDIKLTYSASGADRFTAGEQSVYQITGAGLTALDFIYTSVNSPVDKGPLYAAAHVQGIGPFGEDSGWITLDPSRPPSIVPLPAAVWLLGAGFLGYLGVGYSRRQTA